MIIGPLTFLYFIVNSFYVGALFGECDKDDRDDPLFWAAFVFAALFGSFVALLMLFKTIWMHLNGMFQFSTFYDLAFIKKFDSLSDYTLGQYAIIFDVRSRRNPFDRIARHAVRKIFERNGADIKTFDSKNGELIGSTTASRSSGATEGASASFNI